MYRYIIQFISITLLLGVASSCSKFSKAQRSTNAEHKFTSAMEYYDKGDYYKASVLFEELLPMLRGTKNAEVAQLKYSYCQYYMDQYVMSGYYFKKFYETYPTSEYAEEALFMSAKSSSISSPDVELEQSTTQEALDAVQDFLRIYPDSKYKEECHQMIDKARAKLEEKSYNSAMLYYKLDDYRAAIITFDNFKNDFPESKRLEEVQFLKIKTQYNYAKNSIEKKREERYKQTLEFYQDFIDKYPNSKYLKDAEKIYENSMQEIKYINKLNQKNG
ncbi:MAG TPA: outer membrane protein assembly factor BamD [Cytophagales bacterium]|nr:outer membrane protein assembly factor BamD [Cytophagales bacterium]